MKRLLFLIFFIIALTGCGVHNPWSAENLAIRDRMFGTFGEYVSQRASENFRLPVYYQRPVCDKHGCWVQ